MKKLLTTLSVIVASTALCAGIVLAASSYNVTSTLGGVAGDYFDVDGTMTFDSVKVGAQGVGGVTFFNGTIINETTTAGGADIPVTFGDNVRIDGTLYRGATAGPGDDYPLKLNDDVRFFGNIELDDGGTIDFAASSVDLTGSTVTGLASTSLSDIDSLAMLAEAETITANWINTANPWSAAEVADVTRTIQLPFATLYSDADDTPTVLTALTTPNLSYAANQGLFIEYAAGEATDLGTQFVVPSDYASGGIFKVMVDTAGDLVVDANLDFQVAISQTADTAAWDTDMDDEDPVDVPDNAGSPDVVTLTPTDQSDISANDTIFFNLFPDTYAAGEPNLEIFGVWFEYEAVQ
ncbi:MAG: hypothetical protein ABIB97_04310 [Patescibacteria group bacterium]